MTTDEHDPMLARYADVARRAGDGGCVCAADGSPFGAGHYGELDDVLAAAVRVSLGCGNPTAVADLHDGDTVLDLGSGGGLDVLLSARRVGSTGFVYGLDATAEMVALARRNATDAGVGNVEFLHGTIDHVPLKDASVDVVISNCVLVLAGDKDTVFTEIARVLRPGGRIGISDIIRHGDDDGTPPAVDCASRTITVDDYDAKLHRAGLTEVSVRPTDPLGGGLSSAIIRATRPARRCAGDGPCRLGERPHDLRGRQRDLRDHYPTWEDWDQSHLADHGLVATNADGHVVGWAALSPVSDRCADAGLWTIRTGILPEDTARLTVHERAGFRVVGRREHIGRLAGVWRDTTFLERRSHRL